MKDPIVYLAQEIFGKDVWIVVREDQRFLAFAFVQRAGLPVGLTQVLSQNL